MSDIDDLLNPLRYNNLGKFQLTDVRSIGGGVFAQADTLEHLKILDTVVKAYQSVHIPTFGHEIPNTVEMVVLSDLTGSGNEKYITPLEGEVIKIQAINVISNTSDTELQFFLSDSLTGLLTYLDNSVTLASGKTLVVGSMTLPVELNVVYGQSFGATITNTGSIDYDINIATVKLQQ